MQLRAEERSLPNYENALIAAFERENPTGAGPEEEDDPDGADDELGPEGKAAMLKLEDSRDDALEEFAANGFHVGSQDAVYARYKRFKNQCEAEQTLFAGLSAPQRKKRVVEWAKGEWEPYEDIGGVYMCSRAEWRSHGSVITC